MDTKKTQGTAQLLLAKAVTAMTLRTDNSIFLHMVNLGLRIKSLVAWFLMFYMDNY